MAIKASPAILAIANALDLPGFVQITGAYNFQQMTDRTLRFSLPAYVANKQINRVTITEMKADGTYTIQFSRKTKAAGMSKEVIIDTRAPILSLHLRSCIGTVTGLIVDKFDTSL